MLKAQQPPELKIEQLLHLLDMIKPHIVWTILVVIAVYDYFHTSNVINFLILMAAAAGYISLSKAIDLLQGRSMSMTLSPLSEEKKPNGQSGEEASDGQGASGIDDLDPLW